MERDPLNFFQPYERLAAHHENQLTRALLVVLRMVPLAHNAWLRLVDPELQLQALPPASYQTQRGAVRRSDESEGFAEFASVFLTPERPLEQEILTESDRNQVLDAIIDYGGETIVVVENKVAEADAWQAKEINVTGARVNIEEGQAARIVLWPDLLAEFSALLERELVSGAEARLLEDFLTYTEDHFAGLGPFRTLGLCRGNRFRQDRRLRAILSEATGLEARIDRWAPYVHLLPGSASVAANAYLRVRDEDDSIELALFPADTLSQARVFYADESRISGLRDLVAGEGWQAGPNFHFGHFQRGFVWTTTTLDIGSYLDLWAREISDAAALPRGQWDRYWEWLETERIATPADRAEFERHFTDTERSTASPRPGIWLSRAWNLGRAEELDSAGRLVGELRGELDAALPALGERPLREAVAASVAS